MSKVKVSDVVLVRGERILLVQQKNESAFGKWGLPGGRAEPGEDPRQTIVREIREELGLTLGGSLKEIGSEHPLTPDERHLDVTTFSAVAPDEELAMLHDELTGFGWFTLEGLETMRPMLRSSWIINMAKKALEG